MVAFSTSRKEAEQPDDKNVDMPRTLAEVGFVEYTITVHAGYPAKGGCAMWLEMTSIEILRSSNPEKLIADKTDRGIFTTIIDVYSKAPEPYNYEREALRAIDEFKASPNGVNIESPLIKEFLRKYERAVRTTETQGELF